MISDSIKAEWETLLESNTSEAPFEFVRIFNVLVEPYSTNEILEPVDRKEILLDLKESLDMSCDIGDYCNDDNIRQFCNNVAFGILDSYKSSPTTIIEDISSLSNNS